jgi:tRNA threonylcarbamoyladenosine biosynthesis protein TsaB
VFESALSAKYEGQLANIRPDVMPQASTMLALAHPLFIAGQTQSAQEAAPLYVRNRVALTAAERAQGQTL